jgi:large subunit ribosomal protein L9
VADGFARNWLIPKNLAKKATAQALKEAEDLRSKAEARKAQLEERLNDLARQIDGVELYFGRRASPTGKLFGSVTTTEIAEALNAKTGIDINRRRVSQIPLREVGTHEVPVRLGSDTSPILRVTIIREEEFAAFMQAQQAPTDASTEDEPANIVETVVEAAQEAVENVASAVTNVIQSIRDVVVPDAAEDEAEPKADGDEQ